MKKLFGNGSIELIPEDIIKVEVDAVVTAANSGLKGGGGVDGAIHRAAGPLLLNACRDIGGCRTGLAVITPSFDLSKSGVRYIVHAVGPVWRGGAAREAELLQGAYHTSLELAEEKKCESIAFPSISTGVYGFPVKQAAPVAIKTCIRFLETGCSMLNRIVLVLFDDDTFGVYRHALEQE